MSATASKPKTTKRRKSPKRSKISRRWLNLFALIPGYDPVTTAGDCWFDESEAERHIEFFSECLHHVKGELAGQALTLESWQAALIGCLFGWKRQDGTRRYREAFWFLPRKNGKTTLAAGVVCDVTFLDDEPGAEIYSAAGDREQASLVFEQVRGMVQQEPELAERCRVFRKAITIEDYGISYKPISRESSTKHGYNTHCAIVDELHVQKDRDLIDTLATSTGARRQPLILYITTSDYERASICNEKHDYASKVRDGLIEDASFFPAIWEASKHDDWTDEAVWRKANPNLGVSLSLDYMRRECIRAQDDPSYENTFKRLHLNIRTEQAERWIQMHLWDACPSGDEPPRGAECYGGLDLASRKDIAAFALYFPETSQLKLWYWVPEMGAHEREREDQVPYMTWGRQGFIKLTDGDIIDYDVIRRDINAIRETYPFREIAVDPWGSQHMQTQLTTDGVEIIQFGQNMRNYADPCRELASLVASGKLSHGGDPVLRWMASNVMVLRDDPDKEDCNMMPSKKKSHEKIDGIVAALMAIARSLVAPEKRPSVYETRGIERI